MNRGRAPAARQGGGAAARSGAARRGRRRCRGYPERGPFKAPQTARRRGPAAPPQSPDVTARPANGSRAGAQQWAGTAGATPPAPQGGASWYRRHPPPHPPRPGTAAAAPRFGSRKLQNRQQAPTPALRKSRFSRFGDFFAPKQGAGAARSPLGVGGGAGARSPLRAAGKGASDRAPRGLGGTGRGQAAARSGAGRGEPGLILGARGQRIAGCPARRPRPAPPRPGSPFLGSGAAVKWYRGFCTTCNLYRSCL